MASANPMLTPREAVKRTHLAEKAEVEFRAEVFDITNTPAFAQPNGSFGSAASAASPPLPPTPALSSSPSA